MSLRSRASLKLRVAYWGLGLLPFGCQVPDYVFDQHAAATGGRGSLNGDQNSTGGMSKSVEASGLANPTAAQTVGGIVPSNAGTAGSASEQLRPTVTGIGSAGRGSADGATTIAGSGSPQIGIGHTGGVPITVITVVTVVAISSTRAGGTKGTLGNPTGGVGGLAISLTGAPRGAGEGGAMSSTVAPVAGGTASASSVSQSGGVANIGGKSSSLATSGGTAPTGGATSSGGAAATTSRTSSVAGGVGSGGSTSAGAYCPSYTDLGKLPTNSNIDQSVPTETTCFRFTVDNSTDLLRGLKLSNCDSRTAQINGTAAVCTSGSSCDGNLAVPRASDGYWYVDFGTGTATRCRSNWWWW